jgi:hypothetical protein
LCLFIDANSCDKFRKSDFFESVISANCVAASQLIGENASSPGKFKRFHSLPHMWMVPLMNVVVQRNNDFLFDDEQKGFGENHWLYAEEVACL